MEKERTDGVDSASLDAAVKKDILKLISCESGETVEKKTMMDDVSDANSLAASQFLASHASAPALPSSSTLLEIGNMDENDPNREKLVLSEIEKFRIRQAQRDKYNHSYL